MSERATTGNDCVKWYCGTAVEPFEFNRPDIANPLKPTASTRKEMATPLLWEYPTTSSKVASMPNPGGDRQTDRQTAHTVRVNHTKPTGCWPSWCQLN